MNTNNLTASLQDRRHSWWSYLENTPGTRTIWSKFLRGDLNALGEHSLMFTYRGYDIIVTGSDSAASAKERLEHMKRNPQAVLDALGLEPLEELKLKPMSAVLNELAEKEETETPREALHPLDYVIAFLIALIVGVVACVVLL